MEKAIAIIEAYCRQSFGTKQVTERIAVEHNIGQLNRGPIVKIDAVRARAEEWSHSSIFGASGWSDIHPETITRVENKIEIPGGFLDSGWSEADVTYTIGFTELPEPIQMACTLLADRLDHQNAKSYKVSALLTEEIIDLITPYMRR